MLKSFGQVDSNYPERPTGCSWRAPVSTGICSAFAADYKHFFHGFPFYNSSASRAPLKMF